MVWVPLNRPDFGVINHLSECVRSWEWKESALTSVRRGPNLIMASDYSGGHSRSRFQVFSFVLADAKYLWLWDELRSRVRHRFLRDSRSISFKNLGDRRRAKALESFLQASDVIPGLLGSFLIESNVASLFRSELSTIEDHNPFKTSLWSKRSFEKLMRVSHLGSFLLSGMSAPGQNLLWITDQDEIVANEECHAEATRVIAHVSSHYLRHPLGHLQFATTASDDQTRIAEDLAGIADLAAGALCETSSVMKDESMLSDSEIVSPLSLRISRKARTILAWLADNTKTLKRLNFVIRLTRDGGHRGGLFRLVSQSAL